MEQTTQNEPLLKQAEAFYARAAQLTDEMETFQKEAADLEAAYPQATEEQQIEIDWKLHKASSTRRAAIKFVKRGDKLMKRWEKYAQ